MLKLILWIRYRFTGISQSRWLNRYSLAAIIFLIWLMFFDKHNFLTQLYLTKTVHKMEREKADYERQLLIAIQEKKDLELNKEKYAREKYLMHKEDEDVFIIQIED